MNKAERAINRLKYFGKRYNKILVAFSGGKDSVVLYDLVKKANINATIRYNNTTLDPPGTIKFIRDNYSDVVINHPKESFFKLIEQKGLPSRFYRWCCQYLKESNNKGFDLIVLGVRRSESIKRSGRKLFEKHNNENQLYPIIDWTDEDVWDYINKNKLLVIKYYKDPYNFNRHGCVMCPLASSKQQIREAKMFPNHLKNIVKSVKKFRETHQHLQFVHDYKDEYEMVYLWLKQELNKSGKEKLETDLFQVNPKEIIESIINKKPTN